VAQRIKARSGLRRAKVNAVRDGSVQARLKGRLGAVWRFVSGAPLTYGWLVGLLITTIIQHLVGRRELQFLLVHDSTKIRHLATDPLQVLFSSLLWIDGRYWTPYLLLFTLFLAPAEHWLGRKALAYCGIDCSYKRDVFQRGFTAIKEPPAFPSASGEGFVGRVRVTSLLV
jgi:hypothetical protein